MAKVLSQYRALDDLTVEDLARQVDLSLEREEAMDFRKVSQIQKEVSARLNRH